MITSTIGLLHTYSLIKLFAVLLVHTEKKIFSLQNQDQLDKDHFVLRVSDVEQFLGQCEKVIH